MAMNEGFHTVYGVDRSGERLIVFRLRGRAGRQVQVPSAEWDGALSQADHPRSAFVVALPVRDSLAQWVRAPFPSLVKARRVFPSLLDAALPFPVESCAVHFLQERREAEGGVQALAFAARHETLDDLLLEWKRKGLNPEWVLHEGWALWAQALTEKPVFPGRLRIIGHWNDSRLVLAVGLGRRMDGAYNVSVDANEGPAALATAAARIRRVLRARWQRDGDAEWEWGWSGTRAVNLKDMDNLLQQLDPPEGGQVFVLDQPDAFLARALAWQCGQGRDACNFRTSPREHPKTERRRLYRSARSAVMLAVAGIGLCLVNLGAEGVISRRDAAAQSRLTRRVRQLTESEHVPRGLERHAAEQYMQDARDKLERLKRYFEPSAGYRLGVVMEMAEAGDLLLDRVVLSMESVEIRGSAAASDRVRALQQYLEDEGYIVEMERLETAADARIGFALRGVRHGA